VALLEGLAAGTFIYVGATEVSSDEFETTAAACRDTHIALVGGGKGVVKGRGLHSFTSQLNLSGFMG